MATSDEATPDRHPDQGPTGPPLPEVDGVEHRWVQVEGVRLHVALAGPDDGPVMVLIHGWPQHWWVWRGVIPVLAEAGWRVIAPDLRGCGWSDAPPRGYTKPQLADDVVGLLDALGVSEFRVVGHDWGGWIAQLLARDHPDRVQAATLVNIASIGADPKVMARSLHRFLYQPVIATPGLGPALQNTGAFWKAMGRAGLPQEVRDVYRAPFGDPAHARAGSRIYRDLLLRDLPDGFRNRATAPEITPPISVVMGLDDPVIRPAMVEDLQRRPAGATLVEVPGCGHFIVDQRPDLVAAHLLEFHGTPNQDPTEPTAEPH